MNGIILFIAGFLAGGLNSVAGGGSFISLPVLLFTGVRPVLANTTSTVALWPGSVASAIARLRERAAGRRSAGLLAAGLLAQLLTAIYGGYFGGGIGILMLATLSILGMTHIHAMNGVKAILGSLINGVAVVAFLVAGAVAWGPGVVVLLGATLGGWTGARVARRLPPERVRAFVLVVAWGMTGYFFFRS